MVFNSGFGFSERSRTWAFVGSCKQANQRDPCIEGVCTHVACFVFPFIVRSCCCVLALRQAIHASIKLANLLLRRRRLLDLLFLHTEQPKAINYCCWLLLFCRSDGYVSTDLCSLGLFQVIVVLFVLRHPPVAHISLSLWAR